MPPLPHFTPHPPHGSHTLFSSSAHYTLYTVTQPSPPTATVLWSNPSHCTLLHHSTLHFTALQHSRLHRNADLQNVSLLARQVLTLALNTFTRDTPCRGGIYRDQGRDQRVGLM